MNHTTLNKVIFDGNKEMGSAEKYCNKNLASYKANGSIIHVRWLLFFSVKDYGDFAAIGKKAPQKLPSCGS